MQTSSVRSKLQKLAGFNSSLKSTCLFWEEALVSEFDILKDFFLSIFRN